MRLDPDDATRRLSAHDHGVLSTVHHHRGVHAVPVVYAVDDVGLLGIPIDTVKPKSTTELQRARNVAGDPRATLLVDHWDRDDWSRLWWVRADLEHLPDDPRADRLGHLLARRYPQYAEHPFATVMVFRITAVTGWSAS